MKKAHEVTIERWSALSPVAIARAWANAFRNSVLTTPKEFTNARKLRITIRVEVVDE